MLSTPDTWWLVVYDDTTQTATRAIAAVATNGTDRALEWIGIPDEAAGLDLEDLERELTDVVWPAAVKVDRVLTVGGVALGLLRADTQVDSNDVHETVAAMSAAAETARRRAS